MKEILSVKWWAASSDAIGTAVRGEKRMGLVD
jgi:hypothetical protein